MARMRPLRPQPGTTLDASWDRRLGRGLVAPDAVVDLHGHNLADAYAVLEHSLEQAIAAGQRLVLLITGKPPADHGRHSVRPVVRGAIRAAVGDWLAASRHAGDIAAVRNAHPRHGGAGALYIVLRRRR
jgi:DNA-nicking Smr family endonuclease